jgi:hypothetical protein
MQISPPVIEVKKNDLFFRSKKIASTYSGANEGRHNNKLSWSHRILHDRRLSIDFTAGDMSRAPDRVLPDVLKNADISRHRDTGETGPFWSLTHGI